MDSRKPGHPGLSRREFVGGIAAGAVVGSVGIGCSTRGSHPHWDKVADVVVVGAGGAGCAAAVSAVQSGARVLIMESAPMLGGASSLCIGSVTAPLSSLQIKAGIQDSVEAYMENILEMAGAMASRMDLHLLRLLAENSGPTIDWLLSLGVDIQGPFEYPDHKVKRMHMLCPKAAEWPKVIRPWLEQRGVEILLGTKGVQLYRDSRGEVIGVQALDRQTQRTMDIKARRAVILTAGNLEANPALKQKVTTPEIASIPAAVPTNDGSGLMMAAALGADMTMLQSVGSPHLRGAPPGPSIDSLGKQEWMPYGMIEAGAIVVNKAGTRFINEEVVRGIPGALALKKQPDNVCYMVFDRRVADVFNKWPMVVGSFPGISPVSKRGGWCFVDDLIACKAMIQADTIEDLAMATGIDPSGLKATIEKWNGYSRNGSDPEFHRQVFGRKEASTLGAGIGKPPFYCHSPLKAIVTPAETSLVINTNHEVIDVFGKPIPRLFAGGNMGHGNLVLGGPSHQHGMHMAWAFTSGRLSGRKAAALAPWS